MEYHLLHRAGKAGAWRPIVGIVALVAWMFFFAALVVLVPFIAVAALQGKDLGATISSLTSLDDPTPGALAYLNIALASLIPATFLVSWVLHGLKPGWLTSVMPRMRWRFFVACLGLAVVALIATLIVSAVLPQGPAGEGTEITGELNAWTSTVRDFVLVVAFLTPFQAAGEEYLFRGYLTQAFGGLFGSRVVAVVVPAVLFALAHGLGQSVPVFFDRLAFGLVAGVLVILTGGLEAGIAMHVLNNWLAFGLALAFGDLASTLNPTGGTWWSIPSTLTQSLVFLALAWWVSRRMGLRSTVDPLVLEPSAGRV
ncbi:lysostaphin resistance A-like protein [Nocardioides sp.]|uniref:CPBP family intramembrane glutamic endopeptidase n=1 Tax=Nocardioides sp. TaxID=35761 RepID=UPI003D14932B